MARVSSSGLARGQERAQYMVEFGLTFIFFIFVVLATINMMLMAYNFNLAQRASWEAARKAAVGASNSEVSDVVYEQFVLKMFASPFMISKAEFDTSTWIVPNAQADRVLGTEVIVTLRYTIGFSFIGMSNIQASFPIKTRLYIIAQNDNDRDNLHDTLNDPFPGDHDNDGIPDETDPDDDNDGIPDAVDVGEITWNGAAYKIRTKNSLGVWQPWTENALISSGFFAAPIIHSLRSPGGGFHSYQYAPALLSPMQIPKTRPNYVSLTTMIDLSYDSNNNGWEDKAELIFQ